jgi:ribosomal protein S12 methylthiotransferase
VLVVNTCGFVANARRESLQVLRRLAGQKRRGQVLIAAGCLPQYWGEALTPKIPGVDALLGTRRWSQIGALVEELLAGPAHLRREPRAWLGDPLPDEQNAGASFASQGASAYLKIADGCSAPCAFCAIPRIKGPAISRSSEAIVQDAAHLVGQGAAEIILVAQDTTAYGRDRGEHDALPGLMQDILDVAPELRWLRLMYTYPGHVSPRLIERMACDPRICHYLDLPLQHAHPDVLRRMKRPADPERTRRQVDDLRAAMPDLALRSTFIVGFPGETEAEFRCLLDFVSEVRFDRLGVFTYSAEEGTAANSLPHPVPDEVRQERYDRLMQVQQGISRDLNRAEIGRTLEVLVEGEGEAMLRIGRSYRDAPEVDGLVFFDGDAPVGAMVPVQITGSAEYDLFGEPASGPQQRA